MHRVAYHKRYLSGQDITEFLAFVRIALSVSVWISSISIVPSCFLEWE